MDIMKWYDKETDSIHKEAFIERMNALIDTGLSHRKASRVMSTECSKRYTPDSLRMRFSYANKSNQTAPECFVLPPEMNQPEFVEMAVRFFRFKEVDKEAIGRTFDRIVQSLFPREDN